MDNTETSSPEEKAKLPPVPTEAQLKLAETIPLSPFPDEESDMFLGPLAHITAIRVTRQPFPRPVVSMAKRLLTHKNMVDESIAEFYKRYPKLDKTMSLERIIALGAIATEDWSGDWREWKGDGK